MPTLVFIFYHDSEVTHDIEISGYNGWCDSGLPKLIHCVKARVFLPRKHAETWIIRSKGVSAQQHRKGLSHVSGGIITLVLSAHLQVMPFNLQAPHTNYSPSLDPISAMLCSV